MAKIKDFIPAYLSSHQDYDSVYLFEHQKDSSIKEGIEKFANVKIDKPGKKELNVLCYPTSEEAIEFINTHKIQNLLILAKEGFDSFSVWECAKLSGVSYLYIATEEEGRRVISEWSGKKEDIELSVIFPVYNVAQYLEQCIESINKWGASYVEYLFVNDGSIDESSKIIEKYAKKDPRIKLINKVNGGCASARNEGLKHAKGKYVGFVDPDDFIDETMFKKLFAKAIEGSVDIVWCNFNEYYNNTKESKPAIDFDPKEFVAPCYDREKIINFIAVRRIAIWRGIYRKQMLEDNNISFNTNLRRFDDLPFKVQTFAIAKSVAAVNEHLYYYRLDREGQDVSANDERLYVHFDIFRMLDDFFKRYDNFKMNRLYEIVKFDTHNWALSKIKKELVRDYSLKAKDDLLSLFTLKEVNQILKNDYHRKGAKTIKRILNTK